MLMPSKRDSSEIREISEDFINIVSGLERNSAANDVNKKRNSKN